MNAKVNSPKYTISQSHRAPLYFLVFSGICQFTSIGLLVIIKDWLPNIASLIILHCALSFLLARWLSLSLPWQIFNLLLVPGVVLFSWLELPAGFALFALVVTVLIYLPTFWTRVPYFPTSPKVYEVIAAELPKDRPFRFIDLGCGFGRLLSFLSKARPNGEFEGVELSPLPYLVSRLRFALHKNSNVKIGLKNFWTLPLAEYDYVYAFLAPGPMPYLWEKVQTEMKSKAVFMTNSFAVSGEATKQVALDDKKQHMLYTYTMSKNRS